jgi:hypothetical protein
MSKYLLDKMTVQQEQWEADLPHYGQPPMLRFPVEGGKPGEMFERPGRL